MLTQARLKQLLHYNPETGLFTRLQTTSSQAVAGKVCSQNDSGKYLRIMLDGIRYKAHRLAILYMTGEMPEEDTDHINGIKTDNRFCNLRQATRRENTLNTGARANSTTGIRNIVQRDSGKYRVRVSTPCGRISVGEFTSLEEATAAYNSAARAHHGAFYKEQ